MNANWKFLMALSLGIAAISAPVMAHHSFAMFDANKVVELKDVTVVEFRWANPHAFLIVKSGEQRYALECYSPSAMTSLGWKFNSVKAGDRISVTMHPLRNGKPGGALKAATLANGQTLG
ncbi:MAG: hypothetical protein KKD64_02355 [Alphaproteobacteria bacterium]|nr:hypothetical protein [Alphaproteobacteria bacterium]MBU0794554.1 hypothetical protein [Alphaproteobacteria bacterium]MBU0877054.1 hypothetical protein [Alphaproteobacteria bacterium]MBU1768480.1 hypothetical protein [Alphaproteobacteria bacterium]